MRTKELRRKKQKQKKQMLDLAGGAAVLGLLYLAYELIAREIIPFILNNF